MKKSLGRLSREHWMILLAAGSLLVTFASWKVNRDSAASGARQAHTAELNARVEAAEKAPSFDIEGKITPVESGFRKLTLTLTNRQGRHDSEVIGGKLLVTDLRAQCTVIDIDPIPQVIREGESRTCTRIVPWPYRLGTVGALVKLVYTDTTNDKVQLSDSWAFTCQANTHPSLDSILTSARPEDSNRLTRIGTAKLGSLSARP